MENKFKTEQETEKEILELNKQFSEFLHTKGISAKFKLAFKNMSESAKSQREADKSSFEAVKAQSEENNKDFAEFLRTKGIKAKYELVIENIKKGVKSAPDNTASQIAKVKAETQKSISNSNAPSQKHATSEITASTLEEEFNAFLKSKGLDNKYTVSVTEE